MKIDTSKIKKSYLIIFITAITFVVFSPVINNQFINLDDNKFIYENDLIKSLSPEQISKIFNAHIFSPWYKPLVYLSWTVEYKFFKLNPFIYHINNLMFHIINSILVFYIVLIILKKLFDKSDSDKWIAFFVAMLFAVHPMKVESVAWAMERKDVLFSFFFLSSLLCYFRYVSQKKILFLILGSLLFGFGLLSKSMIITLPFVLFVVDYLFERKFNYKLIVEKIPFFLLFICGLFLYGISINYDSSLQGLTGKITQTKLNLETNSIGVSPAIERLVVSSYRIIVMSGHLIYPSNLSIVYPLSEYPNFIESSQIIMYVYSAVLIFILLIGFFARSATRVLLASTLFFIFTIVPVLAMPGESTSNVSDRYTYMPSIALFFLIGLLFRILWIRYHKIKIPLIALSVGIILALTLMTYNRCRVFNNSISLWDDVIKKYPISAVAYNNRGTAKADLGDYQSAIIDFTNSISIQPYDPGAHNNRGVSYIEVKEYQLALADFQQSIKLDANYLKAYFNKGMAYEDMNENEQAISNFDMVNKLNPAFFQAYKRKGDIYFFKLQNYTSAISEYTKAIALKPSRFEITNNRGVARHLLGNLGASLIDYKKASMLSPENAIVQFNIGMVNIELGRKDMGCKHLYEALRLGYQNAKEEIKKHCQQD